MNQVWGKRKMIDLNLNMSVIILNVNGLIALIKRQKLSGWIKKARPNYILPISLQIQRDI